MTSPTDPTAVHPGEPVARALPDGTSAESLGRVHFIGVGGAGMSGIAKIMLARGMVVSGSDGKQSRALGALRAHGAEIWVGHDASHLDGAAGPAETVVASSAIRADNPEVVEAKRRGTPVILRAAALAALMTGRRGIAIAGTHGKTTTTSMLVVGMQGCGEDPSFAVGADLNEAGSNAHHGTGEWFVAEADESDGSFLLYQPEISVVTNVEADHVDHYAEADAIDTAFQRFADRVVSGGTLVICSDDPGSARLAAELRSRGNVLTYGEAAGSDLQITNLTERFGGSVFTAALSGRRIGTVTVSVPGKHNALNAGAAVLAGQVAGLPAADFLRGLASYTGVRRRFELKGTVAGVSVYDDYAHHPTEVAASIAAARSVAGNGRLVVAFQPHRYSRTRAFAEQFGRALSAADEVVVLDVYGAGEPPEPGVSGRLISDAVTLPPGQVAFEPRWADVPERVVARAQSGDLVITMGAGDITMLGPEVLHLLQERESGGSP